MRRRATTKPVSKLTVEELEAMSAEFDSEFVADTFSAPSPQARRRWERARRKRGRPRVGAGAQAISVTIEKSLLSRVDRLARRRKTSRAQIITQGLRRILAAQTAR